MFTNNSTGAFVPLVIFSGKIISVNFRKSVFVEIICVAGEYSENIAEQFCIMEIVFIRFG